MSRTVAAGAPERARSLLPQSIARLHDRVGTGGMFAAGFLLTVSLLAVLAPVVAPYGPNTADLLHPSAGPSGSHLLGTDELGRDLVSRLIWGARSGLLGPGIVISIATVVAIPLAALAGWLGGAVDLVVGRLLDLLFAFPGLLLAILVVSLYGTGLLPCAIALSLSYMPWIARVARSGIVRERNKAYIAAADVQGLSGFAICTRHLIPNISSIIWSQATIAFGYALIDLAALSFLGLNVQPPTADWGVMVNNEAALLQGHPLQVFYPCLLIVLSVTAVTYLGNRLADADDGRT